MNKQDYEELQMEVIEFDEEDVITTSGEEPTTADYELPIDRPQKKVIKARENVIPARFWKGDSENGKECVLVDIDLYTVCFHLGNPSFFYSKRSV